MPRPLLRTACVVTLVCLAAACGDDPPVMGEGAATAGATGGPPIDGCEGQDCVDPCTGELFAGTCVGGVLECGDFPLCGTGGTPSGSGGSGGGPVAAVEADWSTSFGHAGYQGGDALAVHPDGGLVIAGAFSVQIDLGGAAALAAANNDPFDVDVFFAKLGADGSHVWSHAFVGTGDQRASDVAVDPSGAIVLVGEFAGTIDLGGEAHVAKGPQNVFVAKFDAEGGLLWSRAFGGGANGTTGRVAVEADGSIVVAGGCNGTVDFGGGPVIGDGPDDAYVVKLDAAGNHLWSHRFEGTSHARAHDVATVPGGGVVLTGMFRETLDASPETLTSAGDFDAFVIAMDPTGTVTWARALGSPQREGGDRIEVDGTGNVVAVGAVASELDTSNGPVWTNHGGFVLGLDGKGDERFTTEFQTSWASNDAPWLLALTSAGEPVVAGAFDKGFSVGPLELATSYRDMVLFGLTPDGAAAWAQGFGDDNTERPGAIAVDAAGALVVTGDYFGAPDFGNGPLPGASNGDMFLARFVMLR